MLVLVDFWNKELQYNYWAYILSTLPKIVLLLQFTKT